MKNDNFYYIFSAIFIIAGCVWSFVLNIGELIAPICIGFFLMGIGIVLGIRRIKKELFILIEENREQTHTQE